jgi:hypothetical protein
MTGAQIFPFMCSNLLEQDRTEHVDVDVFINLFMHEISNLINIQLEPSIHLTVCLVLG